MCRRWENDAVPGRLLGRPLVPAWVPAGLCGLQRRTLPVGESQGLFGWYQGGEVLGLRPIRRAPG